MAVNLEYIARIREWSRNVKGKKKRFIVPALPYLLSFAAGAMLYVVVEELIPEISQGEHSNTTTS